MVTVLEDLVAWVLGHSEGAVRAPRMAQGEESRGMKDRNSFPSYRKHPSQEKCNR